MCVYVVKLRGHPSNASTSTRRGVVAGRRSASAKSVRFNAPPPPICSQMLEIFRVGVSSSFFFRPAQGRGSENSKLGLHIFRSRRGLQVMGEGARGLKYKNSGVQYECLFVRDRQTRVAVKEKKVKSKIIRLDFQVLFCFAPPHQNFSFFVYRGFRGR